MPSTERDVETSGSEALVAPRAPATGRRSWRACQDSAAWTLHCFPRLVRWSGKQWPREHLRA